MRQGKARLGLPFYQRGLKRLRGPRSAWLKELVSLAKYTPLPTISLLELKPAFFKDLLIHFRVRLAFPSSHPPRSRSKLHQSLSGTNLWVEASNFWLWSFRWLCLLHEAFLAYTRPLPSTLRISICGARRAANSIYWVLRCLNLVIKTFEFKDDSMR